MAFPERPSWAQTQAFGVQALGIPLQTSQARTPSSMRADITRSRPTVLRGWRSAGRDGRAPNGCGMNARAKECLLSCRARPRPPAPSRNHPETLSLVGPQSRNPGWEEKRGWGERKKSHIQQHLLRTEHFIHVIVRIYSSPTDGTYGGARSQMLSSTSQFARPPHPLALPETSEELCKEQGRKTNEQENKKEQPACVLCKQPRTVRPDAAAAYCTWLF